jgi:hypothetical protein
MFHLLVDTSVWLDLAKRRDGQKWIVPIRALIHQKKLKLLVPTVMIDEFERKRRRIEMTMTSSVAERFRLLKKDLEDYGGENRHHALDLLDSLAYQVPLIGAMTTSNFNDIAELLRNGHQLAPTGGDYARVVQRGMEKKAPFHHSKNRVADALLIELYRSAIKGEDLGLDRYCFVTSNHEDFSLPGGDRRQPHPDLAELFVDDGSEYFYQVGGLEAALHGHFGEEFDDLVEESDFQEEPRTLKEILEAEQEYFDRIWYERHLVFRDKYESGDHGGADEAIFEVALEAAERVRNRRPDLRPAADDFEWGMWNGKLSALRWILGSEGDFLDT